MRAAWLVIGVALALASGCAQSDWIDRTLVTVNVTGEWRGDWAVSVPGTYAGNRPVVLTLERPDLLVLNPGERDREGAGRRSTRSPEAVE